MGNSIQNESTKIRTLIKVGLLIVGLVSLLLISRYLTGSFLPTDPHNSTIFQGGLLLIILGSLFLEDKFTKPIDGLVNGLTGAISLLTIPERTTIWWIIFGYCLIIFFLALISIAIFPYKDTRKFLTDLNNWTHSVVIHFGKATFLFSMVFLFSVFIYYGIQSREAAILVAFWGGYVSLLPLKIPQLIQSLFYRHKSELTDVGTLIRIEDPNLAVVEIKDKSSWTKEDAYFINLPDGNTHYLLPVFHHMQNDRQLGTALILDTRLITKIQNSEGRVFSDSSNPLDRKNLLANQLGLEGQKNPIGTICEGATIGKIRFEVWSGQDIWKGMLVFCIENGAKVYYQVLDGITKTEDLTSNERGFTVVEAIQLGTWDLEKGFCKYRWLPRINSLVFGYVITGSSSMMLDPMKDCSLGCIPNSDFPITFDLEKLRSHHLAILGTTGRGKTELAISLVNKAVQKNVKVFIVDLTLKLLPRLDRSLTELLKLESAQINELNRLVMAVDTGEYGGKSEKKALNKYVAEEITPKIDSQVHEFIHSRIFNIGILELNEITNNEATVRIIELYLTAIFNIYRSSKPENPIWIVLEEAHTIVPETGKMGISDYSTQAEVIGRISQIALQGRKYNVGLMILAQRTANVSKTVLTQCNSIISFAQYDKTGLDFLGNFFGDDYAKTVPNLEFLEAVAYGYGVKSDRPVIVKLKEKSKEELGRRVS